MYTKEVILSVNHETYIIVKQVFKTFDQVRNKPSSELSGVIIHEARCNFAIKLRLHDIIL